MNPIDLISNSPKVYIFQKISNKKNLGGLLTLIYFIFLILLFVIYFYDYSVYEKYEYHDFYKFFESNEQIMTKKKDPEYNPPTNFSFEVYNEFGNKLTENFSIIIFELNRNKKEIKMNEIINKKADEFSIIVASNAKVKIALILIVIFLMKN